MGGRKWKQMIVQANMMAYNFGHAGHAPEIVAETQSGHGSIRRIAVMGCQTVRYILKNALLGDFAVKIL